MEEENKAPEAQPEVQATVPVNPAPEPKKDDRPEWMVKFEEISPVSFWLSVSVFFAFLAMLVLFASHRSFSVLVFCLASVGIILGRWEKLPKNEKEDLVKWIDLIFVGVVFFFWFVLKIWSIFGAGGFWGV